MLACGWQSVGRDKGQASGVRMPPNEPPLSRQHFRNFKEHTRQGSWALSFLVKMVDMAGYCNTQRYENIGSIEDVRVVKLQQNYRRYTIHDT
jgi:hypothetical protein